MEKQYDFNKFINIIRKLRSEDGCPWDKVQTHKSLKSCMLEEAYEAVWAIDNDDMENLKEELGDVLLQVALHSIISEQSGGFTVEDVIQDVAEKMIRRHPHVFGDKTDSTKDEISQSWEQIKQMEHDEKSVSEGMRNVPQNMPAAMRAQKIQKKAAKAGVNFEGAEEALDYAENMLSNLKKSLQNCEQDELENQYELFLFAAVNLSAFLGLNAENSLTNGIDKFINRFVGMERIANSEGKRLSELPQGLRNDLWKHIKNKNRK